MRMFSSWCRTCVLTSSDTLVPSGCIVYQGRYELIETYWFVLPLQVSRVLMCLCEHWAKLGLTTFITMLL